MMLDSGATRTLLTTVSAGSGAGDRGKEAIVHDAQGNTMTATSLGPLWATLVDSSGRARTHLLDEQSFVAPGLVSDLLSLSGMTEAGWDLHITNYGKDSWAAGRDGRNYPLERSDDGHFYLRMMENDEPKENEPMPSDDVDKHGACALAASIHPRTNGLSAGGARQPVRWPARTQAPPAKPTTKPTTKNASSATGTAVTTECTADTLDHPGSTARDRQHDYAPGVLPEGHDGKLGAETTGTASTGDAPTTGSPTSTPGRTVAAKPATVAPEQADVDAEALHEAHIQVKLEASYDQYRKLHAAWNHSTPAVDEAIKKGIIKGATKPPNFHCIWCEMGDPIGARFVRNTKTSSSIPLVPFHHVEIDLWGHLDVGDRTGNRFMFGALDRATGKLWLHPLRAKSEAITAIKRFLAYVSSVAPGVEQHLTVTMGKHFPVRGVRIVSSDRGGEWTVTNGATHLSFEELVQPLIHRLNTPNTPKSGTTRIEGVWRKLVKATRASLLRSGLKKKYFWDAMVLVGNVYNQLPTEANKLGHGEAPDETLGLPYDLSLIPQLGAPAYLRIDGDKGEDANEMVIVLGYNHDGSGTRVMRQDGTIVTSIHVRLNPDDAVFNEELKAARADPAKAKPLFREHFNLNGGLLNLSLATSGQLEDLAATGDAATIQPSGVVQVGNAPGDGGSRSALNAPAPTLATAVVAARRAAKNGKGRLMSDEDADALITGARAAGQLLCWLPGFSKAGKSRDRYRVYSKARTWQQYDKMLTEKFISGETGTPRAKAVRSDLRNDVARGILTFRNADTPIAADLDLTSPAAEDDESAAAGGGHLPMTPLTPQPPAAQTTVKAVDSDDEKDEDDDNDDDGASDSEEEEDDDDGASDSEDSAAGYVPINYVSGRNPSATHGMTLRHRANAATISREERELLHIGLAKRPDEYTDLPVEVVLRAAAMTMAAQRPINTLPTNLKQALMAPDCDLWIAALFKEISGLKGKGVWEEVLRSDVPAGTSVVPSQLCFTVKSDGTRKCRWVARGDLMKEGQHYIASKSSMAAIETVRMQTALAAGAGWKIYACDFGQAFVAAPADSDDLYLELPEVPPEFEGTPEWGHGGLPRRGGRFVAHMKRNIYGLVQAGRVWQQHLMTWMIDKLHARLYLNDRCAFEWSHTYADAAGEQVTERLIGTIHVDDVLFTVEGERVRAEFMRLLKADFNVTGCEDEADEATMFTGIQIRRDWARQTVTLHQTEFTERLLAKHGLEGCRIEPMPYKTKHQLEPWTGDAVSEAEHFDYMSLVGDLVWLCKTRVDIAWRVSDLSRFTNRPGPDHFAAAMYMLRYLKGSPDAGVTYHGSDEVLNQSYDHRNKIILAADADFDHTGALPCVSGVVALLNGGAIAWKVRRQTTRSANSTEAEVKACSLGVELIRALTDLYGEFMHTGHGMVRSMIDSTGARSLIRDGMDAKASAPIKRAQRAAEEATEQGIIWLDLVPGTKNPADLCTKNLANIGEFREKNGIICGSEPFLYESKDVRAILAGGHTPLLKPKKKAKKKKN